MSFDGVGQGTDPFNSIQIAIKNNLSIFYFAIGVPIHVLFSEDAISESLNASSLWNSMNLSSLEFRFSGNSIGLVDKFKRNNVFLGVEKSPVSWLFFAKFKSTIFLFDVLFNMGSLVVNVKCSEPGFLGFIEASLSGIANN